MCKMQLNRTKSNLQVIKFFLLIILYSSLMPTCWLKTKVVNGKRFVIHVPMKIRTHHHIHTVFTQMHGKDGSGGGAGGGGGNVAATKASKQQTIYKIMGYSTHTGGGGNEGGGGGGKRGAFGFGQHYGRHGHRHGRHGHHHDGGSGSYGEINYDDYTNCDNSLPHAGDMIFNHYSRQDEEDYPDVEQEEEIIDDDEQQESSRINTSLNNTTLEVTSSGGGNGIGGNGLYNTLENPLSAAASSSASTSAIVISHRQRFATLNCINGSNVNNVEEDDNGNNGINEDANIIIIDNNNQFIVNHQQQQREQQRRRRPFLCRTPPPNYPTLPVTPPPSYTPRQHQQQQQPEPTVRLQENSRDINVNNGAQQEQQQPQLHQQQQHHHQHPHHNQPTLRRCQVPEALGLPHEGQVTQNRLNVGRNILNEPVIVNRQVVALANGRFSTRNVATVSHHHPQQQRSQQQLQQRRRKQRRRRLHLLQQQQHHQQLQQNPTVDNNSSTDSESSTSFTDTSESDHDVSIGTTRDQRRRRRQRLLKLRDAYCPDLLNACSLILLQQQTSDSTVGSFTDTPPERFNDTTDYVEIEEFRQRNPLRNNQQPQKTQSLSQIYETIQRRETTIETHNNRLNGVNRREEEQRENRKEDNKEEEAENQRLYNNKKQKEMGQNLSIRRPRISLTWVLREQSQQQQQTPPQNQEQQDNKQEVLLNDIEKKDSKPDLKKILNNNHHLANGSTKSEVNHNQVSEKKRYRLKHIPGNTEPLNGYATTPTGYTNTPTALGSQKFFSNQNLLEYHKDDVYTKPASKDLLFVCTPQRVPDSFGGSMDALALAKKRNEIRKKLATKMAHFRAESQTPRLVNNISNNVQLKKDIKTSLKSGSYSEPSLIAASEGNSRRHRHRKRRERNRTQKFGYEIKNVDEFLNKCSLASPGNIPMVLSTSCILYQTRPGGYQTEISLPLGMVVNAVFKNQNWLYVQTPHAEEGYVNYNTCLPLGILPPEARKEGSSNSKPTPCWETNGDIFPKPCGNMTDSEKEIHLRVGSRSEGARTPHLKNSTNDNDAATIISVKTDNTDCLNGNAGISSIYGEQQVDKLYLRAASQPKLSEKTSYAQLKIIRNHSSAKSQSSSYHTQDEYVTLQQQQQQQQHQQQLQQQQHNKSLPKHVHHIQTPQQKTYITRTFITNGHNGQHLHPKDMKTTQQQHHEQHQPTNCNLKTPTTMIQQNNASTTTITVTSYPSSNNQQLQQQQQTLQQSSSSLQQPLHPHHQHSVAARSVINAIRRSSAHCGQRQTLVAITTDYTTDVLTLHKGDIVTLCECRETKDHRQWFYVRTRDGRQGYIPAEVAGHGYL